MFTKICAWLGAVSFIMVASLLGHMNYEARQFKAPPSLTTLQESVVRVETESGICTGWILAGSNKVITAAHCFEGTDSKLSAITFHEGQQVVYKATRMGDPSSVLNDIVVLEPEDKLNFKMPAGLSICKTPLYIGEPTVIMGVPLNVTNMVTFGYVANPSYKQDDPANPMSELNGAIALDTQLYQGNSGGPVMDANTGCVLGSAELIVPISVQGFPVPTGVAFAIPIPKDI